MTDEIFGEVSVVVAETESTEIQIVRIGGAAGVRVTQSAVGSPTVVKRVTTLNDSDNTVRIGRELLEELHRIARSEDPEAAAQISKLLPPVG